VIVNAACALPTLHRHASSGLLVCFATHLLHHEQRNTPNDIYFSTIYSEIGRSPTNLYSIQAQRLHLLYVVTARSWKAAAGENVAADWSVGFVCTPFQKAMTLSQNAIHQHKRVW
jgi:hypothetical protein